MTTTPALPTGAPAALHAVDLHHAYRLLNTGPTVLLSTADGARRDVMACAWVMPLDYTPPKVALVIDKRATSRELLLASGEFAINVPCSAQADVLYTVGSVSGREVPGQDKFTTWSIDCFGASQIGAPLIAGCVGWLECRLLPEASLQDRYDLFVGEVLAAWADAGAFTGGKYRPVDEVPPALRTVHHLGGGQFMLPGAQVTAQVLPPRN